MNFAALRQAVYDRLGVDPSNDTLMSSDKVGRFVNLALHEIEAQHPWSWLQKSETLTTAAGTETVTPAADWRFTTELRNNQGRNLERYSMTDLNDRWMPLGNNTTQGPPIEWAVWQSTIYLRPIPDGVYTLTHYYLRSEVDLAGDTDTPLIPDALSGAVIEYASYLAFRRERNDPRAAECLKAYQVWEQRMQRWEQPFTTPGRVRVRPGHWL